LQEFARVLGGGVVPGSIVLIGGDPGIGKSTLMLQVALEMAAKGRVLYVSGEESERQIKMRALRLLPPKEKAKPVDFPEGLFLVTETNAQTIALSREVAALSDQVELEVLNPYIDRDRAAAYGIDVAPSIVVEGARDYGIRFLGFPGGYEFANLIDSIVLASSGEPGLSESTKASLEALADDVTIKVFTTPT
jgi:energy-coupling factor transporter ATP-binding protein EcfA2